MGTVVSSGLQRALQTAQPTADRLGVDVEVDEDLAEFDPGGNFYIPIEELVESDPRLVAWRTMMADAGAQPLVAAFRERVIAAVERLRGRVDSGAVAVFCHGGVIGVCVEKAVGGAFAGRSDPEYGSITRVTVSADGGWALRTYNEIQHVEHLLTNSETSSAR